MSFHESFLPSFSDLVSPTMLNIVLYTIGLSLYAIFIWFYYRRISKRDIFTIPIVARATSILALILKYIIVFPFVVFFWLSVLSLFLFFLAKNLTVEQILLTSLAIVTAIRITSYYKEQLSEDIAKLIPLVLLGIFIVDPSFFSYALVVQRLQQFPTVGVEIIKFLFVTILVEWILRAAYTIKSVLQRKAIKVTTYTPPTG